MYSNSRNASFQSTHPLRGATCRRYHWPRTRRISIHAPLAGCDSWEDIMERMGYISIHAPLAGCDRLADCAMLGTTAYFNPRTPCGVRRCCASARDTKCCNFNPRTPCGVRQQLVMIVRARPLFQSTHPLRGATLHFIEHGERQLDFNPRTPCGVRPGQMATPCGVTRNFNPRTPCGVRLSITIRKTSLSHFNPRTPCGVRPAHPATAP